MTYNKTQSKTTRRMQIMDITLHFKFPLNQNKTGRQMYFPAYRASTQQKEHRLSQVWIYCVLFSWNYNIYLICRISLSFMKKQLLCSAPEGLLIYSFSSSSLAKSSLMTRWVLRNCLSFLFLLYSMSACAALPQL